MRRSSEDCILESVIEADFDVLVEQGLVVGVSSDAHLPQVDDLQDLVRQSAETIELAELGVVVEDVPLRLVEPPR